VFCEHVLLFGNYSENTAGDLPCITIRRRRRRRRRTTTTTTTTTTRKAPGALDPAVFPPPLGVQNTARSLR